MRKNASIITIYDINNYGNRLQNYAVQTVLESLAINTVTISTEKNIVSTAKTLKYHIQRLFKYKLPGSNTYWRLLFPRFISFDKFNKKYIHTKTIKQLSQLDGADFYVLGSDQVWNATWYDDTSIKKDLFLLTFARPKQKVCFAPSFGKDELPEEWIPWFRDKLKDFPYLSVREDSGARLIQQLTGKKAEVLIDPTMMLNASQWLEIAKKPSSVDFTKPYLLTYFLGNRSEKAEECTNKIAAENGLVVYNLLDKTQPDLYTLDPCEFIYLISQAKIVLTDSFHACVFSFLFEKPFIVFRRKEKNNDMISRIETLLKKFELERKYADSNLENDIFEADYRIGHKTLIAEREKTLNFLKKSLGLK